MTRFVYGQADPNGIAAGGATVLREAGIAVEQDADLAAASEALNPEWTFSVTHGRPFVRWKYASTLDGFSAAADGSSQWITGATARSDVHRLRAQHGAIVVGTGTVLADDPQLTVRDVDGHTLPTQPLRVVVGDRDVPTTSRVFDDAAETIRLPHGEPREVLAELHRRDVHAVWLEGGPQLAAAFLRDGLVDEVIAYIAPALLGAGRAASADFGAESIDAARRFDLVDVTPLTTPADPAPAAPTMGRSATTDLRLTLKPLEEI